MTYHIIHYPNDEPRACPCPIGRDHTLDDYDHLPTCERCQGSGIDPELPLLSERAEYLATLAAAENVNS